MSGNFHWIPGKIVMAGGEAVNSLLVYAESGSKLVSEPVHGLTPSVLRTTVDITLT